MNQKSFSLNSPTSRPIGNLPEGSLRIVQITDSHLYADTNGLLAGINTQHSFDQVLAHVQKRPWPADMVLATGDLVHDASVVGYQHTYRQFAELGVPVHCLPGNHDLPAVMQSCILGDQITVPKAVVEKHWVILLLDSTIPAFEGGHLRQEELEILESNLSRYSDLHALVCLHHHPVPIGSTWMDRMALDNPDPFFNIIDKHDHVKGILWGHIHQEFNQNLNGIQLMGSPSTCIQFLPRQAGFGIDPSPPGYRWLELLPDGQIRSGIERLEQIPAGLDMKTAGYS
ncbi:MAG: 3',5'-cyclic-AMP phosphodiesterase [Gammaproteobacteria bacterium]|nr:3',5'-cyclic-AMP phosphodiesterase [Gammaproteobacteria bacterium]